MCDLIITIYLAIFGLNFFFDRRTNVFMKVILKLKNVSLCLKF